jgi:RNA polymerase sigma factor (TIGR02999 family)
MRHCLLVFKTRRDTQDDKLAMLSRFDSVYQQIKAVAHAQIARHGAQTLSTTELVHEAYLKLAQSSDLRASVAGTAALPALDTVRLFTHAVRQVLIDSLRRRQTIKRGENPLRVALAPGSDFSRPACASEDAQPMAEPQDDGIDLFALNQAIAQLKTQSERMALVVELHFFAGLPFGEIAQLFGVDRRTILRDWTAARLEIARLLGVPAALEIDHHD